MQAPHLPQDVAQQRTPSFPFPSMVSPHPSGNTAHLPFTTLSPTTTPRNTGLPTPLRSYPTRVPFDETRESFLSGSVTPASTITFAPPGAVPPRQNPDFPNPNLYEASLLLYSEPGLEAWWSNVVQLMRDAYQAERVSISVPADCTDLENVPWGQKATFNSADQALRERSNSLKPDIQSDTDDMDDTIHAGKANEHQWDQSGQPQMSRSGSSFTIKRGFSKPTGESSHHIDITDLVNRDRLGQVFDRLCPLDVEDDALLDNSGVLRVLERGRPVVLSREYISAPAPKETPRTSVPKAEMPSARLNPNKLRDKPRLDSVSLSTLAEEHHTHPVQKYEDFEQAVSSPWAQSPAPSPAIRLDPNENPFFAAATIQADTFNPASTPQDYSTARGIEAIGVERSVTIIHVPLVRPLAPNLVLSESRLRKETPMNESTSTIDSEPQFFQVRKKSIIDTKSRPPIAILSFLTSAVPYPSNLTHSLSYLAPHLASSFSVSRQFSQIEGDVLASIGRQSQDRTAADSSMNISAGDIEELSNLDRLRQSLTSEDGSQAGTGSASVTSPSDYSAFSKSSPGGSIAGTPAWDPGFLGLAHSTTNTPALPGGSEFVDSYFSARRAPLNRAQTTALPTLKSVQASRPRAVSSQTQTLQVISPQNTQDAAAAHLKSAENEPYKLDSLESLKKGNSDVLEGDVRSENGSKEVGKSEKSMKRAKTKAVHNNSKSHTLLHSYGADLYATFQSLQPTSSMPRVPQHKTIIRPTTAAGLFEMPPPSDRLLRTIIDAIPVQVFTAAPHTGDVTWVNSRYLMYRGQSVQDFLRDPWQSLHPDDREKFLAMWRQALKQGEQFSHQARLKRFDGAYRWFYIRAAPLRDTRGVAVHWFGTNMDIHEQHVAEVNAARQEETAASETKYRALANSSPQIVFACTERDGITFANNQWIRYSGQTLDQALGIGFTDCVHPEDLSKCRLPMDMSAASLPMTPGIPLRNPSSASTFSSLSDTALSEQTVLPETTPAGVGRDPGTKISQLADVCNVKTSRDGEGRISYSTEVRLRNKEGDYRWHLVRVVSVDAINFGNGEGTWFGTCTDINDHKLLEQRLKETMDSKTRFLSNMSHEIRTPLIGISGMVNFLLDTNLTGEQLDYCSTISSSADGLLQVINDILDLSKAEAGMMRLAKDWFQIRSLIEETNELLSSMAIQKRLELNYIVDEDVPSIVKGDRIRVRQVLLNIIGNAIKFTGEGEIFSRCSVVPDSQSGREDILLRFEIDDTGPGFTKADAELMFKPFSQIDGSSTRQHGGSGLGLVISRQLVELHGGTMHGTSVPGHGSTFIFTARFGLRGNEPLQGAISSKPPRVSSPTASSASVPRRSGDPSIPLLAKVLTQSPIPSAAESPALASSGSSDPSIMSNRSFTSARTSMSSYITGIQPPPLDAALMKLSLPSDAKSRGSFSSDDITPQAGVLNSRPLLQAQQSRSSESSLRSQSSDSEKSQFRPPLYSILVVCGQRYSIEAIASHVRSALPKKIPSQITTCSEVAECIDMVSGSNPITFTHIVISVPLSNEIISLLRIVLAASLTTSLVILSDPLQRTEIMQEAPEHDYDLLQRQKRVQFVYKPVKPSKLVSIFDPNKEISTVEEMQSTAQLAAQHQRDAFIGMERDVGNKGHRLLLVEDNPLNRKVMLKFLDKIGVIVELAVDGQECTEKVFGKDPGYYSVILCDLHMPRKDGYQTCNEIRQWEVKNHYPRVPIIALSANVMDDAIEKALGAGFDKFFSKPVNFTQVSQAMAELLGKKTSQQ